MLGWGKEEFWGQHRANPQANRRYTVCINLALKRLTVGDSGELMIIMPEKVRGKQFVKVH